jgi:amino acid permease
MNPKQKWVIIFNNIFSVLAFIIFEYSATHTYLNFSSTSGTAVAFFWTNQALAIIFFFAAYFSTKTLRRFLLQEKSDKDVNKPKLN